MADLRRGCVVCGVTVRIPALLCTDCGGDANGSMTNTQAEGAPGILVYVRPSEGPVEVTGAMLDECLGDLSPFDDDTLTGADILTWLAGATVGLPVAVD